jgi:hypothetical protein
LKFTRNYWFKIEKKKSLSNFPDLKLLDWLKMGHVEKVIIVVFLHCYLEFLIPFPVLKVFFVK